MLLLRLIVGIISISILFVYTPQGGRQCEEKDYFYTVLVSKICTIPPDDMLIVWDLNGHIVKDSGGFEGINGGHGLGRRNAERKSANDRMFGEQNSTELRKLIFKMSQKMKDDNNSWKEIWPSTKIPKQKLGKCFRVSLKSWWTPKQTSCTQYLSMMKWSGSPYPRWKKEKQLALVVFN